MNTTRNRGKEASDDKLFAEKWHPVFREAVDDLCYLLSRGYGENSALQIVGNRYRLNRRQQNAILRISCSDEAKSQQSQSECQVSDLENVIVEIDGFNLLILLENALSGAYLFKGRDGLYRDISSVHGSYKRVVKTEDAIRLIGKVLMDYQVKSVKWYLDQPVSNSGRLKTKLMEISRMNDFGWEVELVYDPDKVLAKSEHVVISSDGWILKQAKRWFNLGAVLIENHIEESTVVEV